MIRLRWLARLIAARLTVPGIGPKRPPDVVIGGWQRPYLLRWWLVPRNRFFNVYLHQFCRSDDDRALHDHPWPSVSIALSGTMQERYRAGQTERLRSVHAGDVIMRGARFAHRLNPDRPGRRAGRRSVDAFHHRATDPQMGFLVSGRLARMARLRPSRLRLRRRMVKNSDREAWINRARVITCEAVAKREGWRLVHSGGELVGACPKCGGHRPVRHQPARKSLEL